MPDLGPLWLSLALAGVTTAILVVVGTPLAWWLSVTTARWRPAVEAVTALPLVLPPTVLGFYFLIALGPASPIGGFWLEMTGRRPEPTGPFPRESRIPASITVMPVVLSIRE